MVVAALLTADPTYYVYFIQRRAAISGAEADYSLIIGARMESCSDSSDPVKVD